MKRKTMFLQYILQQDQKSMMYKVFEATCNSPLKNDFVQSCKKYLEILDIKMSFEEIAKISKWKLKKIVKEKTRVAAFSYLIKEKNKPGRNNKMSKIACIEYEQLEIQEYLYEGNENTNTSKFIFKARAQKLDIKMHKKWKYSDTVCVGCGEKDETGEEILSCKHFDCEENIPSNPSYESFYSTKVSEIIACAKVMMKRLKVRQKILDTG